MPAFYNQATLTYNNQTMLSNIVTGEVVEALRGQNLRQPELPHRRTGHLCSQHHQRGQHRLYQPDRHR